MRADDVVHAVGENRHVLLLRAQHFLGEDGVGIIEDAPEKRADKTGRHAVAQPAGQHFLAVELKVLAFFKVAVFNQKCRLPFRRRHAAPDFRDQQADVVIDPHFRPDVARRGNEGVVTGQGVGNQRGVQVNDRRQRVERAFGQRAFRTGAGGGGRFAGHAGNEFHEQLRQFHVMNRD